MDSFKNPAGEKKLKIKLTTQMDSLPSLSLTKICPYIYSVTRRNIKKADDKTRVKI